MGVAQLGHTQNVGVVAPRAPLVKTFRNHHWPMLSRLPLMKFSLGRGQIVVQNLIHAPKKNSSYVPGCKGRLCARKCVSALQQRFIRISKIFLYLELWRQILQLCSL